MKNWNRLMLAGWLCAAAILPMAGCDDDDNDAGAAATVADGTGTGGTDGAGADETGTGVNEPAVDADIYVGFEVYQVLAPPVLTAPANGAVIAARAGAATVRLRWNSVEDAASYKVKVNGQVSDVDGTSFRSTRPIGTYNWQAAAVRPDPATGGTEEEVRWSETWQFTVADL